MARKGFLISLEGIDGCGKSTQARLLFDRLRAESIPTELFGEPGGSEVGDGVRRILLSADELEGGIGETAELLLFAASRAELVRRRVRPALARGSVVILDRFADSSTAYQGYGRGVDRAFILDVNRMAASGLTPELTLLLDMTPETASARLKSGSDRIEKLGLDFFRRVREGYLSGAFLEPARIKVIDGSQGTGAIADEIYSLAAAVMGR